MTSIEETTLNRYQHPTPVPPTQNSATNQESPSDSSFSLGGSAVWVGDESGLDLTPRDGSDGNSVISLVGSATLVESTRQRSSTDASSSSSQAHSRDHNPRVPGITTQAHHEPHLRSGLVKDTHFYHTTVAYRDHQLPIKMPLYTFPEEVGDVRYQAQFSTGNSWDVLFSVFLDYSDKRIFLSSAGIRTSASSSPHEWAANSPHYHSVQCPCNWEAHHFLGPSAASRGGVYVCTLCMCSRIRMWGCLEGVHRACIPLCQPQ